MSIHPNPKINGLNVLGEPLASCCFSPITGYFRNGFCHTAPSDIGQHTVCVELTSEFLSFSQRMGNDLITPLPEHGFPGLQPGDFWCLCVTRWVEAYQHEIRYAEFHQYQVKYSDKLNLDDSLNLYGFDLMKPK